MCGNERFPLASYFEHPCVCDLSVDFTLVGHGYVIGFWVIASFLTIRALLKLRKSFEIEKSSSLFPIFQLVLHMPSSFFLIFSDSTLFSLIPSLQIVLTWNSLASELAKCHNTQFRSISETHISLDFINLPIKRFSRLHSDRHRFVHETLPFLPKNGWTITQSSSMYSVQHRNAREMDFSTVNTPKFSYFYCYWKLRLHAPYP